ncbi:GNAT family N-acetyltransferase [Streptomyces wedmorensis]
MDAPQSTFVPAWIEQEGLRLCPWGHDSATKELTTQLCSAAADPAIALWNPLSAVGTARAEAWLEARAAAWEAGTSGAFAVVEDGTATLLGSVTVRWVDRPDGLAMIGYWTVPAARGHRVAVRAARAATRWAFDIAHARRIELAHAGSNEASCRVAEHCGYLYEGTLRASHLFGDGRYHDEHLHARLATDPEPTV